VELAQDQVHAVVIAGVELRHAVGVVVAQSQSRTHKQLYVENEDDRPSVV
jgi:hypothetical protein